MHFGVDKEGRDSQRRMRELVRDMQVDVLGLLETDCEPLILNHVKSMLTCSYSTPICVWESGSHSLYRRRLGLRG